MDLQRVFVALLRSSILLLIAVVSSFLVATAFASQSDAQYEARALVDAQRLLGDEDAFSSSERADRTVANELIIAREPAVAELAAERIDAVDVDQLLETTSIEQLAGTDNIAFVARADGATAAARQATAYATAYAAARLEQRRAALLRQADDTDLELAVLSDQLGSLPPSNDAQAASQEQVLREQYETLIARELELRTSARSVAPPEQLVLPAPEPDAPAGPAPLVWGAVAAFLALVIGSVLFAVHHRVRDPVEWRPDLEELGLRVLAEAPAVRHPWRRSRGGAGAVETAVAGLLVHDPAPAVVAVLAADGADTSGVVDALHASLSRQGAHLTCVPASTATAPGLQAAREADLVLVVARRGVTPRGAVAQLLELLDAVRAADRLAVLLDAHGFERSGDQPNPSPGPGGPKDTEPARRRNQRSNPEPPRTGEGSKRCEPSPLADDTG